MVICPTLQPPHHLSGLLSLCSFSQLDLRGGLEKRQELREVRLQGTQLKGQVVLESVRWPLESWVFPFKWQWPSTANIIFAIYREVSQLWAENPKSSATKQQPTFPVSLWLSSPSFTHLILTVFMVPKYISSPALLFQALAKNFSWSWECTSSLGAPSVCGTLPCFSRLSSVLKNALELVSVEVRDWHVRLPLWLFNFFFFWKQDVSLSWKFTYRVYWLPSEPLSPQLWNYRHMLPNQPFLWLMLFCGYWESELGSSCLRNKHLFTC